MKKREKFSHGEIHWSEYCSDDAKATLDFCQDLFGWQVMFEPSDNQYFLKHGDNPMVSIFQRDENVKKDGLPPHVSNYVAVKDYESTLSKAVDQGAEIIMENEHPSGNHKLAVLKIPGNLILQIVEYFK